MAYSGERAPLLPGSMRAWLEAWLYGVLGYVVLATCVASSVALLTWSVADPSFTHATSGPTRNLLGPVGAILSDLVMQLLGLAGVLGILPPVFWALELIARRRLGDAHARLAMAPMAVVLLACAASALPKAAGWPLPYGFGGLVGDQILGLIAGLLAMIKPERAAAATGLFCLAGGLMLLMRSLGLSQRDMQLIFRGPRRVVARSIAGWWRRLGEIGARSDNPVRREPTLRMPTPPPSAFGRTEPAFDLDRPTHPIDDFRAAQPLEAAKEDTSARDIAERFACKSSGKPKGASRSPVPTSRPGGPAEDDRDPIWGAVADPGPASDAPSYAPYGAREPTLPLGPAEHRPGWGIAPPAEPSRPPTAWCSGGAPDAAEEAYGRAVAVVLSDRKASNTYLKQRLDIGYMEAADLLERMQREGILGAAVYNGVHPILVGRPGAREV
jgi:DNA segregation ATPase FtsK/SpoIIIE-like protein